jgi:hypothetical protein
MRRRSKRGAKRGGQTIQGDPRIGGALQVTAEHARDEDGTCFVVVDQTGRQVGAFTLEVPHLQLAFFVENCRCQGGATSAAAKLVDPASTHWTGPLQA